MKISIKLREGIFLSECIHTHTFIYIISHKNNHRKDNSGEIYKLRVLDTSRKLQQTPHPPETLGSGKTWRKPRLHRLVAQEQIQPVGNRGSTDWLLKSNSNQ